MTEQTPEREEARLTTDGQELEFVSEGGDQRQFVDEDGETVVEKVTGQGEFTTENQSALSPDEDEIAMPRPGGLVQ